jgi:sialidase-1
MHYKPCFFFLIAIILHAVTCGAQSSASPVFENGVGGYACYRIPAIIKAPNGDLLAFAEARKSNCTDFGDIDIVMKRSTDYGKTWSDLKPVVDNKFLKAGNPTPVVDNQDQNFPMGRTFLLYNTATTSESDARKGVGVREVWVTRSSDHGKTWDEPVNISTSVHKPLAPSFNPAYNFPEDWRTNALAPGHAFQFVSGKHKGRIFVPANHSVGSNNDNRSFNDFRAHCFYSDDHGATWQLGADVPIPGGNESTAAELEDGGVVQNIRYQNRREGHRILAFSSSGGEAWDTVYIAKELPDPACQGSMISFKHKGEHILLFSNPSSQTKRERLTIRASMDNGQSWPLSFLVDPGPSAYSDIVYVRPREIGVLYEKGSNGGIFYISIPIRKLLDRK